VFIDAAAAAGLVFDRKALATVRRDRSGPDVPLLSRRDFEALSGQAANWLIIADRVYDVTPLLAGGHPGGPEVDFVKDIILSRTTSFIVEM
jgi:hypothetical protein